MGSKENQVGEDSIILVSFRIRDSFSCVDCRPSTFAQAAKLRRMAAAKEKELAKRRKCVFPVFFMQWFLVMSVCGFINHAASVFPH